ncbi:hypothetical protein J6590_095386 [Homalodisca vitripennis]|nr:hypothetical protein J6590_095386 [Homalodisca vitripennis]
MVVSCRHIGLTQTPRTPHEGRILEDNFASLDEWCHEANPKIENPRDKSNGLFGVNIQVPGSLFRDLPFSFINFKHLNVAAAFMDKRRLSDLVLAMNSPARTLVVVIRKSPAVGLQLKCYRVLLSPNFCW